jgi:SAM-dependent methyltransferase
MYRTIVNNIPKPVKRLLTPIYDIGLRLRYRNLSHDKVLEYWRNPYDGMNNPDVYAVEGWDRSEYLATTLEKYIYGMVKPTTSVLEIGCNVGRNLECIRQHGFGHIGGVEINETAIIALKKHFPELAKDMTVYNDAVENVIKDISTDSYDVVFGMGSWEHIHKESEWVFIEIARVAKTMIVTMEDEHSIHRRIFPRNYKRVFEPIGNWIQVEEFSCKNLSNMGSEGTNYVGRVFKRREL